MGEIYCVEKTKAVIHAILRIKNLFKIKNRGKTRVFRFTTFLQLKSQRRCSHHFPTRNNQIQNAEFDILKLISIVSFGIAKIK